MSVILQPRHAVSLKQSKKVTITANLLMPITKFNQHITNECVFTCVGNVHQKIEALYSNMVFNHK